MLDLRNYDEMCCPDCGRQVIVQIVSDTRVRFEGCTRRCRDKYDVPDGSILFGALGAPQFIYTPLGNFWSIPKLTYCPV